MPGKGASELDRCEDAEKRRTIEPLEELVGAVVGVDHDGAAEKQSSQLAALTSLESPISRRW